MGDTYRTGSNSARTTAQQRAVVRAKRSSRRRDRAVATSQLRAGAYDAMASRERMVRRS